MHVIINRQALAEVLDVASRIAASRTTKEVLKCVRLTTVEDGLILAATDLEVSLRAEVKQVEVKQTGDVLVPADKLTQIARESLDETLSLEADGQTCHIRGRDSHFEVYGQSAKEFPPVPELTGTADLEMEAGVLAGLIERTVFAVAKESTRYAINGLLWERRGKKLTVVATDGRRLAWAVGTAVQSVGEDAQIIVPARTIHVLQRVLAGAEGNVALRFSSNQVVVHYGGYVISSALAEGRFPKYQDVIPKDCDKTVELSTDEFLSAVRRAALLTNEQSKGVRLSLNRGSLVLSSRAPEQGEATVSMEVDYAGTPLEIAFNPGFLADALRVVGCPTVTLELKESGRPGMIKVGEEFVYVVMPVSLG